MNKKVLFLVGIASITFIVAVFNVRLNMQKTNTKILLTSIESLTDELNSDELTEWEVEVIIVGSLSWPTKASPYSQPFRVIIPYPSRLDVYYLANLNNITVRIVSASGQTVYSNTVNPVAGGQLPVGLSGLSSGEYTIVFTAPNGSSVYGDFEI